jgi:hypothetical protein
MLTTTLAEREWRARMAAHHDRVDGWVRPYLARRSVARAHPVEDFLFTYYSHSPAALRRWHPGVGVRLRGEVSLFESVAGYVVSGAQAVVDTPLSDRRIAQIRALHRLLTATSERPAALSCFGLHEWAMVYRQPAEARRHATYPLRLGARGTDTVVEEHRIACTHFDAFRFFTTAAQPLNAVRPSRESQPEHEQPGCLHATMDLYKAAYSLSPLIASEVVAECFALARAVRLMDMRAAPYDLSSLGVEPIRIETTSGKAEYVAAQRAFADRAKPLRQRLIETCDRLLSLDR